MSRFFEAAALSLFCMFLPAYVAWDVLTFIPAELLVGTPHEGAQYTLPALVFILGFGFWRWCYNHG